jgi:hypothetical protein
MAVGIKERITIIPATDNEMTPLLVSFFIFIAGLWVLLLFEAKELYMSDTKKEESISVGDRVFLFLKNVVGKITAIDYNNLYHVLDDKGAYYTARYSDIRKIYSYKKGDRVYHLGKCKYGYVDSISTGDILSVVFDNASMVSYVSYNYELVPAFGDNTTTTITVPSKKDIYVGDEVTYVNSPGVSKYTVVKVMGDKVKLKGQYSEFETSIFLLEKYKPATGSVRVTKENIRMAIAAAWETDSGEKTYKLMNVKTFATLVKNRSLNKLKGVMVKTGVKYPGTNDIEEDDIAKFSEMFQKAQEDYET